MSYKVGIVIEKDEHGYYAYCPELEGCQTQGDTFEDVMVNIKEAIELFKLNVTAYPDSWNTYDSLAEAYVADGNTERAIFYYEKSLTLNPKNDNAARQLQRLKK